MVRLQSPGTDPMRYRGFERTEYKPSNQPYQYKAYEPSSVGIYGQKQRQPRTYTKPDKPPPKPKVVKPKTTFDSYSRPLGPDIKVNNMGPAYQDTKYEYKEYKPRPITPYKARQLTPRDPFKAKPLHMDERSRLYKQDVTYKLDKENNAGLRHWNYGFVDDTVATKRTKPIPQEKYTAKEKPKPKVAERTRTPVFAAVAPVKKSSPRPPPPSQPPPPPPVTKSFKNSSTQHTGPGVKTTTTQTQMEKTRTFGTQSDPVKTPTVPVVAPIPVPKSAKKVKTKSQGVQCTETPRKTAVKGTQADTPKPRELNTQPEHVYAPLQARRTTPEYAELARQETPVYSRRSPPTVVPIVTTTPKRQTPVKQARKMTPEYEEPARQQTPVYSRRSSPTVVPVPITTPKPKSPVKQRTPTQAPVETRWTPSPEVVPVHAQETFKAVSPKEAIVDAKPEVSSYQPASKPGRKLFPYQTTQSRLPPEITAYIEAYDFAHGPA